MIFRILGLSFLALFITVFSLACSGQKSRPAYVPKFPPTIPGPPELPYCSTTVDYSSQSPVSITGKAEYQYRTFFISEHASPKPKGGLGYIEAVPRPIRYAEVRVLDSAGNVAQCAETNATGDFSFDLPSGSSSYTVQVNSRSNKLDSNPIHLIATVFDSPESKTFYSITRSVTPSSSQNIGSMVATANSSGELLGGAFNILDQLLISNEYLRSKVGDCGDVSSPTHIPGCSSFTVSPKIEVYWKKGFNPGSYFNSSGGLSFYLPGYGRLFILGGKNGNVDSTDTDHFDNSVIIHEFGHFLEDRMLVSDSPGGSHDGNKIIDPRLAWSEGWGNFLQAAVQNSPYYIDTIGNRDGNTEFAFYVHLENKNGAYSRDNPSLGLAGPAPNNSFGEGNFREFSVTRLLWDAIDSNDDSTDLAFPENISDGFAQIWASLSNTSGTGWKSSQQSFRDIGLFHQLQAALTGGEDWTSLHRLEYHRPNRSEYAQPLTTVGCLNDYNFTIYPQSGANDGGTFATSDLYRNNDFFHIRINSHQNVRYQLIYKSTGVVSDLDLYLYNESARFGIGADVIARSDSEPVGVGEQIETVSASLPAGNYLLNVFTYVGSPISTTNYRIRRSINGGLTYEDLCRE